MKIIRTNVPLMKIWEERETDRPAIGNRSMVVSDPLIREKIKTIVDNLLQ